MSQPEHALYRCDQIRACEHQAIKDHHDELELMSQAGKEAFFFIRENYPDVSHIAVFCGAGNNAGDGYVVARLAHEHGLSVIIYQCKTLEDLPSAARQAALLALAAGVECQPADEPLDSEVELLVDALLGIGLQGPVRGMIANAITQINTSGLPVLSLDIPSGLNADTGTVENYCVQADATIAFIGLKTGMYTQDGPDYCGNILCKPLGTEEYLAKIVPAAMLLQGEAVPLGPIRRKKNSHKGNYGHVLVIGGGPGMPGAVSLAAHAALRTGAGSVTIATWPEHAHSILPGLPEAMIWGVHHAADLEPLLAQASVCVIGPGLGESDWAQELFRAAITTQLPMVIDASALRLLAQHPQTDDNWVLTPHPGEAGSLLACSSNVIQQDRYQAIAEIQKQYGGVVVLKGCGSLIQTEEKTTLVCTQGNPGMASAGMGDILSGIIAGLCAQGLSLSDAAALGVWLHASAGDELAKSKGAMGILASDIVPVIPRLLSGRT